MAWTAQELDEFIARNNAWIYDGFRTDMVGGLIRWKDRIGVIEPSRLGTLPYAPDTMAHIALFPPPKSVERGLWILDVPLTDLHWLRQEELDHYSSRCRGSLRQPPKFASIEEADAWMEDHHAPF